MIDFDVESTKVRHTGRNLNHLVGRDDCVFARGKPFKEVLSTADLKFNSLFGPLSLGFCESLARYLQELGFAGTYYGIDFNERMIEVANSYTKPLLPNPDAASFSFMKISQFEAKTRDVS